MNIKQRIDRSKTVNQSYAAHIRCSNAQEVLVAVPSSTAIQINPIWITPVDEIEGGLYAKYIESHPQYSSIYVRKPISMMLQKAATALPDTMRLILRAGHRPVEVQLSLLNSLVDQYHKLRPRANREQALQYARTYVSDPALLLPPHCCGAAVDVDVVYKNSGVLVDFGCSVNTDSEKAFLHSPLISKQQARNRTILLKAMLSAGFASHTNEWWHYSYGDQIWANFYNKPQSLYGIIEPEL